jgi:signal transduction histidine kinase
MAAGAAHELNNPLAVIAGRAQMITTGSVDEDLQRHLEIIDQQARRASGIVSELLAFANPDPPTPRDTPLRTWVDSLNQHWQRSSPLSPGQIEVTISDEELVMYADPEQLTEAAGAVIANALESNTPENVRLLINSASTPSDDTIVVSFGDNGRGMEPEVLTHALDPFFSHRTAGRSRGLGLSRAARLLEINGGRLWLESQPNLGTTVYFAVPTPPR